MGKNKEKNEGEGVLIAAVNKQARRDYEILDVFEAGMVLKGSEVKSIREGNMNLKESYIKVSGSEVFLVGCHVGPYAHSPVGSHEPLREKKLLLHHIEIVRLVDQTKKKGLTLIPLRAYFKGGRCKLEFGIARGKKLHDKREDIKEREAQREIERVMKQR